MLPYRSENRLLAHCRGVIGQSMNLARGRMLGEMGGNGTMVQLTKVKDASLAAKIEAVVRFESPLSGSCTIHPVAH